MPDPIVLRVPSKCVHHGFEIQQLVELKPTRVDWQISVAFSHIPYEIDSLEMMFDSDHPSNYDSSYNSF